MIGKTMIAVAGALCLVVGSAAAQATLTPSFHAPRRDFQRSELAGFVSFPDGGTAYEAAYRVGSPRLDVGIRGGILDPVGPADSRVLAGIDARARAVTHSENFPLDGAVIFGAGGRFHSGDSRFSFPLGLSLGRQLDVEESSVSVTPFVQPTAILLGGNHIDTDVIYTMGIGADLRLAPTFATRFSVGVGDIEGVSVGAAWVH